MKHYWLITLLGIFILSLTGCYTQLAIQNDDDYTYSEPTTVIIIEPAPPPIIIQPVIQYPTPPKYRERNPKPIRSNDEQKRDAIRNTGERNSTEGRVRR